MRTQFFTSTRLLALLMVGVMVHAPLAFAAGGCDVPMFAGARLFSTPAGAEMAATADCNHDGFTDVAVIGTAGIVSILLGNGDGTFQPAVNYPAGSNPSWIGVADFNGDGNPDLAVAAAGGTSILLGTGDGRFRPPTFINTVIAGAIGDFNGDGKADLTDGLGIALGKGDGTFQPVVRNNALLAVTNVAVGDLNGDGKLDVVAGDPAGGGIAVLLGDGKGGLGNPARISTGLPYFPSYLALADLDGDHKLDIVAYDGPGNDFSVLLGNGNGTFQAPTRYALPGMAPNGANVVIADLNGDGKPDLVMSSALSFTSVGWIFVFSGVGDGTFLQPVRYNPTGQPYWWLTLADFNSDGLPDLLFTNSVTRAPAQVGVMLANADGTWQSAGSYPTDTLPRSPVVADLNGDGIPDVVVANAGFGNNDISVLLGNGDGSFQPPANYAAAFGVKSMAVGDVNGDGIPDLVVGNFVGGNLLIYFGNGDGTFQSARTVGLGPGGGMYIAVGDFNNDGKLDVAVLGFGVSILLGNGDGTFRGKGSFGPSLLNATAGPITVADLNGDGKLDLILAANDVDGGGPFNNRGTISVLLGNGDGTFSPNVDYPIGTASASVAVGDLNGDGKPDLVVADLAIGASDRTGVVAVLLGYGDGTFQKAVRYKVSTTGSAAVAVADFNGDGNLDVASINPGDKTVTILLGAGDGTLRDPVVYAAGLDPLAFTAGDLNGDGKPDLVLVDDVANTVIVLVNNYVSGGANSSCAAVTPLAN